MLVITALAFGAIAARLVYVQGVDANHYLAVGGSEWSQTVTLAADRGSLLDRNGDELAMSISQTTIYADPHQVSDPAGEAADLAPILNLPLATLEKDFAQDTSFVYVARTIPDNEAAAVAKLDLPGIYSLQEPKRYDPAGQLADQLIGTVGTAGSGLSGLEYEYNSLLEGKPGRMVEEIDPSGREIPGGLRQYQAPVPGDDLVLTLDEPLQYDAEQALSKAIVAAGAQSGIALLMDTQTGQILADAQMTIPATQTTAASTTGASAPAAQAQPVEAPSASSFTSVYEPGSVMKLITVSAALQEGIVTPSDVLSIPNSYQVAGSTFHDAESHPTEEWTVTDVVANSSNIGTIEIAQKLGKTDLLDFVHNFGLGSVTSVSFPGESAGLLPTYWSGTSIADVPIGQGISVTAIQMLAAYNAIANGGVYVAPSLVQGYIGPNGKEHLFPAAKSHRVVSPNVDAEMTAILDQVVQVGTGTAANLSPYTVAGKTGTALVPSASGGYEAGHYVASFAGFVPSEKPAITAMVVIDNTPDYGAQASAPTFATIASEALQELEIPPESPQAPVPGVPQITAQNATGAGEIAGTPLPGLSSPTVVAPAPAGA